MAKTTERGFFPSDRYHFDRKLSYAKGWAQFDTAQDASYYGNWTNPTTRQFFSYCEGDTTLVTCETDAEYVEHVRETAKWHADNGYGGAIDSGFDPAMKKTFEGLGLGDLLH